MASFESSVPPPACTDIQKYPIKRLEPTIQKFLKIIDIDIDRLQKHKTNIQKYCRLVDWSSLHKENVNATRTVQQVKANIREIEKTRNQTNSEDLEEFDLRTSKMKQDALQAIQDFIDAVNSTNEIQGEETNSDRNKSLPRSSSDSMNLSLEQVHISDSADNTEAVESWENLHENLVELNAMIHEFSSNVQAQQESVDRIEDNIDKTHENVRSGVTHLGKAAKYKAAIYPVAGAMLGTVLGGPVGFVAGLKIGGLVAVGGGAAGFLTGKIIKKRQDKVTEVELRNLSQKSNSVPDLTK